MDLSASNDPWIENASKDTAGFLLEMQNLVSFSKASLKHFLTVMFDDEYLNVGNIAINVSRVTHLLLCSYCAPVHLYRKGLY